MNSTPMRLCAFFFKGFILWAWSALVCAAPLALVGTCVEEQVETELRKSGPYWKIGAYAFFDRNLSRDGSLSCADCHSQNYLYTNSQSLRDVTSGMAKRRAPTLLNLGKQRWFFWDGRASSLEEAVLHPLYGGNELNMNRELLFERTRRDPFYELLFSEQVLNKWSGSSITDAEASVEMAIAKSLASFLKTLVSCGRSEEALPLNNDILKGEEIFRGKGGCANCHFGSNFSDGQFHNVRVRPIREFINPDSGRYQVIKSLNASGARLKLTQEMWGAFKTPSLRNVGLRPPYMHQGQFSTLEEVVNFYSDFKGALPEDHHYAGLLKPLELSQREKDQVVAFLKSLSDRFYTCTNTSMSGEISIATCRLGD
ncbi:cytochrome-c peroxidase [Azotobacter salinestris]|uniref:cytochrome-c peroxidase n=1 Tax=Azotobacter salinestris TaxID=69964 RepID=UPI0032DEED39